MILGNVHKKEDQTIETDTVVGGKGTHESEQL